MENTQIQVKQYFEDRIRALSSEVEQLERMKSDINEKVNKLRSQLTTLILAYGGEKEHWGESDNSLIKETMKSNRFAGMTDVGKALRIVRKEYPQTDRRQALKIMKEGGFEFTSKRPSASVHAAWNSIDREIRKRGKMRD